VINVIGQGSTSKISHAVNECGDERVIKMYTNRTISESKMWLDLSVFTAKAMKSTETEVNNYDELYSLQVTRELINGHWCAVMPMFYPLTKDEQNDSEIHAQILACLESFQQRGKMYAECNFRWRHIGWQSAADGNREIILFDLAELLDVDPDESSTEQLRQKVEKLAERLN
jgi:hypothetical protein